MKIRALVPMVSVAAIVLSMAGSSQAADSSVESHFQRGVELYAEADFRSAVVEFRRAYEMSKNFKILYNIAQCEYQLTNYVAALAAFERYLGDGGTSVPADRRKEIESELPKIKGRVASVTVRVNVPGASVLIDDREVGQAPLTTPVMLNPGVHRVGAKKSGYADTSRPLEVAGGDSTTAEITLVEVPKNEPVAASAGESSKNWSPAIVAWSAAGAFAVTGVILGVVANGKDSDLQEMKTRQGVTKSELSDADSTVGTMALLTDIAFGAALVSAGLATYFTVAGGSSKASTTTARIAPRLGGLSLSGTF